MKVFISWSGILSKNLAEIFKEWLPSVIQAITPYYSPDDITKGRRWNAEIARELEESQVGLICLTRENHNGPWVLFEAGALSKNIVSSRVCPILFNLDPSEVQGPLVQFQLAEFNEQDIKRVLCMINEALGERALQAQILNSAFDMWWPELRRRVEGELRTRPQMIKAAETSDRRMLEEILQISRSISTQMWRETESRLISPETISLLVNNYLSLIREFNRYRIDSPLRDYLHHFEKPILEIVEKSGDLKKGLMPIFNMALQELRTGEIVDEQSSRGTEDFVS